VGKITFFVKALFNTWAIRWSGAKNVSFRNRCALSTASYRDITKHIWRSKNKPLSPCQILNDSYKTIKTRVDEVHVANVRLKHPAWCGWPASQRTPCTTAATVGLYTWQCSTVVGWIFHQSLQLFYYHIHILTGRVAARIFGTLWADFLHVRHFICITEPNQCQRWPTVALIQTIWCYSFTRALYIFDSCVFLWI